jgi:hypothetical protein
MYVFVERSIKEVGVKARVGGKESIVGFIKFWYGVWMVLWTWAGRLSNCE